MARSAIFLSALVVGLTAISADAPPKPPEIAPPTAVVPAQPAFTTPAAQLSAKPDKAVLKCRTKRGGVLYEEYAAALHTKRLRNEFTSAQWKTILLQKRVRVPLTAEDHRDLLQFFVHE